MADTAVVFLFGAGAFGTMGHVAGTQVGNLPLLQVAAVGGQWAIGFLIAWAAAVANEVWDRRAGRADCSCTGRCSAPYCSPAARGSRWTRRAGPTVRIAGLAPNRAARATPSWRPSVAPGARTAGERAEIRERYLTPLLDDLVDRTQRAARGRGADRRVGRGVGVRVRRGQGTRSSSGPGRWPGPEGIYLQIGVVWLLPAAAEPVHRDPGDHVRPERRHRMGLPEDHQPLGDGNVPGPGIVPRWTPRTGGWRR